MYDIRYIVRPKPYISIWYSVYYIIENRWKEWRMKSEGYYMEYNMYMYVNIIWSARYRIFTFLCNIIDYTLLSYGMISLNARIP